MNQKIRAKTWQMQDNYCYIFLIKAFIIHNLYIYYLFIMFYGWLFTRLQVNNILYELHTSTKFYSFNLLLFPTKRQCCLCGFFVRLLNHRYFAFLGTLLKFQKLLDNLDLETKFVMNCIETMSLKLMRAI